MWHKIKDNLLTIATSLYFLFWGVCILYVYIKNEEIEPLTQKNFDGSWNYTICLSTILTVLSAFLIFALIRKNKENILKILSYIFIPLIIIINILSTIFLIHIHSYSYIMHGSNEQIKQFFTKHNSNFRDFVLKNTPLHASVTFGRNKEIVKFFIDKGGNVNNVNCFGRTPLSYAVSYNSPETVDILIKNGANVNFQSQNKYKFNILTYAILSKEPPENKEKMVELLLNAGANDDSKFSSEGTAFDYACLTYNKQKDDDRYRPVTLKTIELLLKAGANPFSKAIPDALSQHEIAQNFNNTELIELFDKYKDKFILE